jgi:hypothetical protein
LHVPQTPNTTDTVTDAWKTSMSKHVAGDTGEECHVLRTRPVSSTFPATLVPEMRDSRMEDTSEAASDVVRVERERGDAGENARVRKTVDWDAEQGELHTWLSSCIGASPGIGGGLERRVPTTSKPGLLAAGDDEELRKYRPLQTLPAHGRASSF